ncbi:hypothetical protein [Hoeflea sp.]|uniref:hypothetical protein n=1 Tax=Hoeflea sp. TaxID=1940281 RepID=UPI0019C9BDA7|nr:hypothetical protein [Hoeflea sp.]MBC7283265.1 hypothetical protein [Hoeflea sp.]
MMMRSVVKSELAAYPAESDSDHGPSSMQADVNTVERDRHQLKSIVAQTEPSSTHDSTVHALIPKSIDRDRVAAVLRSAQAEKAQDDQDDDHEADDVYDAVHWRPVISLGSDNVC